jgi:nucleotide sugar dehydrogenase
MVQGDNGMNVVVVGAGKMGLPLACQLAENGAVVTACDINPLIVEKINKCIMPFYEPGLEEFMQRNIQAGKLKADIDIASAVSVAEVVIIIVPALLAANNDIDYSNLTAASNEVAKGLKLRTLVSYETTVPIGGCRGVLIPALEKSGLKAGKDFYVCFSPEMVKSLMVFERLQKNPKIVGGYDKISSEKGEEFYKRFLGAPVTNVGSLEAAEFVKLSGMIYRDVNIALANELAIFSEVVGFDIYQIIDAGNNNGETYILEPGIGVGGHCTPVYPYFLIKEAARLGINLEFAELARKINENQPARNVRRLADALGSLRGKTIHVLGVGFRPEVKEHACSPAFSLCEDIETYGAKATVEDPLYSDEELKKLGFTPAKVGKDTMHAVILNTAHSAFKKQIFAQWRDTGVQAVLDGRNFWSQDDVEQAGLIYLCVGKPSSKQ